MEELKKIPIGIDLNNRNYNAPYPMMQTFTTPIKDITFVHNIQVNVGDVIAWEYGTFKIDEIVEQRPAKGVHSDANATFYNVKVSFGTYVKKIKGGDYIEVQPPAPLKKQKDENKV